MTVWTVISFVYSPEDDYTEDEDTETIDVNDDGLFLHVGIKSRLYRCGCG